MKHTIIWLIMLAAVARASSAADVTVNVNASVSHQTWEGFGATWLSLVFGSPAAPNDTLTASQRTRALELLFNQVRLSTGNCSGLLESPANATDPYGQRANDNADPLALDMAGFNTFSALGFKQKVIDLAPPGAVVQLYPATTINIRWASPWLSAVRTADYNKYLDECAEEVLAGVVWWKNTYGSEPKYAQLFNEPRTGNNEMSGPSVQEIVDVIKRCGARLRAAGFNTVKFVATAEETEDVSLTDAQAFIGDATARQYIAALAYHTYPYGSAYSYIPNILTQSGAGTPVASRVQVRNQLRDLAKPYGIPVWMTEVSNGYFKSSDGVLATDFRSLRGRAIHIHDEMVYADAAAYFAMECMWSDKAEQLHFGSSTYFKYSHDHPVMIDTVNDNVYMSGTGYAIGHYARWLTPRRSVRIEATSTSSMVQVTAFQDQGLGRNVFVLINNNTSAKSVQINMTGTTLTANVTGEQSTQGASSSDTSTYWKPLAAFAPDTPTSFTITLPALSVTSLAASTNAAPVISSSPQAIPNPIRLR